MNCLAYFKDASGNLHSKEIESIKVWRFPRFHYIPLTRENVRLMEKQTGPGETMVINEYNELLIAPTGQIDTEERIVETIMADGEVWFTRSDPAKGQ